MFRAMRRHTQQLPEEDCLAVLGRCTAGVLALAGDDGYPYAVPLSYVYQNGKFYFHCATTGHKLDAISRCGKASFCVIDRDDVKPEAYTTYYCSVIAFGRVRVISDAAEKRAALAALATRYSPGDAEGVRREMEKSFERLCMVELAVEHMTGKQAKELARPKAALAAGAAL